MKITCNNINEMKKINEGFSSNIFVYKNYIIKEQFRKDKYYAEVQMKKILKQKNFKYYCRMLAHFKCGEKYYNIFERYKGDAESLIKKNMEQYEWKNILDQFEIICKEFLDKNIKHGDVKNIKNFLYKIDSNGSYRFVVTDFSKLDSELEQSPLEEWINFYKDLEYQLKKILFYKDNNVDEIIKNIPDEQIDKINKEVLRESRYYEKGKPDKTKDFIRKFLLEHEVFKWLIENNKLTNMLPKYVTDRIKNFYDYLRKKIE